MRRLLGFLLGVLLVATPATAQVLLGGQGNPQLPVILGPNGGLKVECLAGTCTGGGGAGGTASTDQSPFVSGTSLGTPFMGARDDAAPSGCAEDTICIGRLSSARELFVANLGTFAVQATQAGVWTVGVSNAFLLEATFTGRLNTLGQKAMAASTPVVLASDQSAIPVTDNGGSLTVDGTVTVTDGAGALTVDGTVTANQGGAPWSENVTQFGGTNVATGRGPSGTGIPRVTASEENLSGTQVINATTACPAASATAITSNAGCIIVPLAGFQGLGAVLANSSFNGSLVMEHSYDGGTIWHASTVLIASVQQTCTAGVPCAYNDSTSRSADFFIPSASHERIRCTVFTSGSTSITVNASRITSAQTNGVLGVGYVGVAPPKAATVIGGDDGAATRIFPYRTANPATTDGGLVVRVPQKRTYAAATTAKTATASGTAPFLTLCGSATTTIRVQRLRVEYTIATAGVHADLYLKKYSSAPTGGTATTLTQTPFDSNSAAGTATNVSFYTVLPTGGLALVGTIDMQMRWGQITATVTAGSDAPNAFEYRANDEMEAVVLRGTAQCVGVGFGTAPGNAPTATAAVQYTEE